MEESDVDLSSVGRWQGPVEFTVERERTVAYAEATNDPIPQHLDGTFAPPVFAVVPAMDLMARTTLAVVPPELAPRLLHGEHDFHIRRPLRPGETVSVRAKPVGVEGKSSGVVVTTLVETTDAAGDVVNEQYFTGFFRGGSFPRREGSSPPPHPLPAAVASDEPVAQIAQRFDHDQTFRYAGPAGDPMRIHLDDEVARSVGLPGIIIHGLCTIAFTSHALLSAFSPEDPTALRRLAVRLSAPARPGQAIVTRVWPGGDTPHRRRLAFVTTLADDPGTLLITDGLAELATTSTSGEQR